MHHPDFPPAGWLSSKRPRPKLQGPSRWRPGSPGQSLSLHSGGPASCLGRPSLKGRRNQIASQWEEMPRARGPLYLATLAQVPDLTSAHAKASRGSVRCTTSHSKLVDLLPRVSARLRCLLLSHHVVVPGGSQRACSLGNMPIFREKQNIAWDYFGGPGEGETDYLGLVMSRFLSIPKTKWQALTVAIFLSACSVLGIA